ncbi:MAG: THUMP domain-containing class I SAM-dependent RNA methyltransferase [Rhodospirillaceae bacterium]
MSVQYSYFASCPRGLETVLAQELAGIGGSDVVPTDGGVAFKGPLAVCYAANLESRVASRVLWQVYSGGYRNEDDIYAAVRALPWHTWFSARHSIRVGVAAIKSPLKSLDFATLRIKDAVCDGFRAHGGTRPSVDTRTPDVRIQAFLSARDFTLYLDTSGEALFKRGYRRESGTAPLRENLAAGILRLTGWDGTTTLLDPMCGSGTFLCEAAMMALDRAPGLDRAFGFEKLAHYDVGTWQQLRDAARNRLKRSGDLPIHGADRYGDVLKLARANLASLGLEHAVRLKQANVLELPPPAAGGILVANPPYGVRLAERDELAAFYPKLGDTLKKKYAGWTAYLFTADMRLAKLIGLKASRRTPLYNGALECRLFEYRIIAGTMRPRSEELGLRRKE